MFDLKHTIADEAEAVARKHGGLAQPGPHVHRCIGAPRRISRAVSRSLQGPRLQTRCEKSYPLVSQIAGWRLPSATANSGYTRAPHGYLHHALDTTRTVEAGVLGPLQTSREGLR